MKSFIYTILLIVLSISVLAQAPQRFNYQAVLRNNAGEPMASKEVTVKIAILQGSIDGAQVYSETHNTVTNEFGMINLQIGSVESLDAVDWGADDYFVEVSVDGTPIGTTQLLSVPYALHAQTAEAVTGEITETDPVFESSPASDIEHSDVLNWDEAHTWGDHSTEGYLIYYTETDPQFNSWDKDYSDLINTPIIPADLSDLTDNANLLFSGNYNDLSNLPVLFDGDYNSLTNLPTLFDGNWSSLTGTPTTVAGYGITDAFDGQYSSLAGTPTNVSEFTNDAGYLTDYTETDPSVPAGSEIGQIQYWSGTAWITLPAGNQGQILGVNDSNVPEWQNINTSVLNPPLAEVLDADNIESFNAQINGNVNANGLSTTVVFEWGTTTAYGQTTDATPSTVTGINNTAVYKELTGLQSNTTYHYRIIATNAVDITYSDDMSFTTVISEPQLSTNEINSITGTSAVSGGNITFDGGSPITAKGVCWSTSSNPTLADNFSNEGAGDGEFTSDITGLALGTTYYVRAYATNEVGTTYANERSFTTVAIPSVTTGNAQDIKGNSAKAGGTVTNDGGSSIISQGLCWGTEPNPTTANNTSTSFHSIMTGLSPQTTYYVRAYAANIAGTGYGDQISFNSGHLMGSFHAGGLVFYNDGAGGGLVCAEFDQSTSSGAAWGCNGTVIGGTSTAINTGAANTNAIVAGCSTEGIAAKLCYDLNLNSYTDWFLPSYMELSLMRSNLHSQGLGNFGDIYWSSSEQNSTYAWHVGFEYNWYNDKHLTYFVRAARAF